MQKTTNALLISRHRAASSQPEFRVGIIVDILEGGRLIVDYPGNEYRPVEARCLRPECFGADYEIGTSVLLVFEGNDVHNPIVLGSVFDSCRPTGTPTRATVDDRVILRAEKEILLECGQSSVLLRSDGKIIIRGVEIMSRASRTNKVRGACVKIN
jgi:Domain of unknown function (DUF6484)